MSSWRAEDLVELTEQAFDSDEAIAMLEAAIAAEPNLMCWPLAQDRTVVRGTLLIGLGDSYFEAKEPERALSAYADAPKTLRRKSDPVVWARAQYRLCGDRADNVERELEGFAPTAALRRRATSERPFAHPVYWVASSSRVCRGCQANIRN
jgi:hypothetical protein